MPPSVSTVNLFLSVNLRFINVLGQASQAVAAIFTFRTVGVEDPHAKVRAVRWPDEYEAIGTNPRVHVRDTLRQRRHTSFPEATPQTGSQRRSYFRSRAFS